jgi:hypothetical protein
LKTHKECNGMAYLFCEEQANLLRQRRPELFKVVRDQLLEAMQMADLSQGTYPLLEQFRKYKGMEVWSIERVADSYYRVSVNFEIALSVNEGRKHVVAVLGCLLELEEYFELRLIQEQTD